MNLKTVCTALSIATLFAAAAARADGEATPPAPATTPAAAPEATPPAKTVVVPDFDERDKKITTWNADLNLGTGALLNDGRPHSYLLGARGGVLFIRDTLFYSVNLAYEWVTPEKATFGVQAEALSITRGVWSDIGFSVDQSGRPGVMLAGGFSLIGIQAEYRAYDNHSAQIAVYATLRIPVGVLAYALFQR